MDTDLIGVMNAFAAAYPYLTDGASIIATGSVAALVPGKTDNPVLGPGGAGYSFAKRTVAQYVHDLALVLAPRMIRVNAVHPTNCNTDLLHNPPMYRGVPAGSGRTYPRRRTTCASCHAGDADPLCRTPGRQQCGTVPGLRRIAIMSPACSYVSTQVLSSNNFQARCRGRNR